MLERCKSCRAERDFMTFDVLERNGCHRCRSDVISSLRSTVHETNVKVASLFSEMGKSTSRTQESLSRLNFLRIQFYNEQADGIPDGDVIFKFKGGKTLYAHKILLAGKSAVFRKMFETEMLERKTGIVEVDDATFPVMHAVIKFCYDAEINCDDEMVTFEAVIKVAHKYGIELLFDICEEHLLKTIDKDNLPRRLKLAKKYGACKLQAKGLNYLKEHFDEVINDVVDQVFWPCHFNL